MNFEPLDADARALKLIELLIQSGHYTNYNANDVPEQITKDANTLAIAFSNPNYRRA